VRQPQIIVDDPIMLPDGRQLVTLLDAATCATKLPKREADTAEWQAAIECLMLVAELGGPTMFARIGDMRALNRIRIKHPSISDRKREPVLAGQLALDAPLVWPSPKRCLHSPFSATICTTDAENNEQLSCSELTGFRA
jgi:hypothetical protein